MSRFCLLLAFAVVSLFVPGSSEAQIVVSGARTVAVTPASPVATSGTAVKSRRPWRSRNPYFAARPIFPPPKPGARPNFTLEPYTRWYYPNERSYYPPLSTYPSLPAR